MFAATSDRDGETARGRSGSQFSAWYNNGSLPLLLILASIVSYAYYLSLAGRPLFKEDFMDG